MTTTLSSAAANKAAMTRFVTEYQTGMDRRVLDEVISDSLVDHSSFQVQTGRAGVAAVFENFHAALDGFHAVIEDQIAEDDKVWTRKSFHGRHVGELFGVPATGRDLRIDVIDIVRFRDGQIVEHWAMVDQLGLMRQMGVLG
jgi:steroid delta-isomerase-like uncharacterized protein